MTDLLTHIVLILVIVGVVLFASAYLLDWLMKEYEKATGHWHRVAIWAVTTVVSIVCWGWLMFLSMVYNFAIRLFRSTKKKRK